MKTSLSILQINDLHGYTEPHNEMVREAGYWWFTRLGGLARIASLFEQVRQETDGATLALDNGDTFHGTHVAVSSRGQALVPMMNTLKLDAMTVHWEFAFTPAGVREIADKLSSLQISVARRFQTRMEVACRNEVPAWTTRIGEVPVARAI